jgi:hypothetical protein
MLNIVKKSRCFDDGIWTYSHPDTNQRWRWIITPYWFVYTRFKGEVYPAHAMTAYKESRCASPLTPNFDTMWSPLRITPRKGPRYPLTRKLCGPQSPYRESNPESPACSRIPILTRLPRLLVCSIKEQYFTLRPLLYKFGNHKIHLMFLNPVFIPQYHIAATLQTSSPQCLGTKNHAELLR